MIYAYDGFQEVRLQLPTELVQRVEERTGPERFARYVAESLQRQLQRDNLDDLFAVLEQDHGPLPQEQRDRAEREVRALEQRFWDEVFPPEDEPRASR